MKNKTKFFLIVLLIWLVMAAIAAAGIYLDWYYNHRFSRIDDRPEPGPAQKEVNIKCQAFSVDIITIGRDTMTVVHHLYDHGVKSSNWGDATVYYNGKAY